MKYPVNIWYSFTVSSDGPIVFPIHTKGSATVNNYKERIDFERYLKKHNAQIKYSEPKIQ